MASSSSLSEGAVALVNCAPKDVAYGTAFIDRFSKTYNESQLLAIAAASKGYGSDGGVTLIKGPPGTGKTTTLVGVLNALHLRQMNKFQAGIASLANDIAALDTAPNKVRRIPPAPRCALPSYPD